ncbi:hypothetical protein SAMN02910406_02489 [Ruminococcus albus]|uniref:Uncharacterized protein n=2 Tax=Ruminococcus albus TaxID=1264 RepID=A0A1I1MLK3_RUMAL|nr:hypothetical protein SAMN02910406_02489 [Ruminococcus albus]
MQFKDIELFTEKTMRSKKKTIVISVVLIILVLAVVGVLTMPRFYRGDRIKLKIRVEGVKADTLEISMDNRVPGKDDLTVKANGDTVEISAKASEYGEYFLKIDGADKPLEIRVMKFDWYERVDADIDFTISENGVSYSAESSVTVGELPFREHNRTSGSAEIKDGYYSVYIA